MIQVLRRIVRLSPAVDDADKKQRTERNTSTMCQTPPKLGNRRKDGLADPPQGERDK